MSSTVKGTNKAAAATDHVTDQAVLQYLRKKGLGSAALELTQVLEKETSNEQQQPQQQKSARDRLEEEDALNRNQRSLLVKSTGGMYGYDRDAAWPVVQWGIPDKPATAAAAGKTNAISVDEAKAYLDSFVTLQLWVLSLPDDEAGNVVNPLQRAQKLLQEGAKEKKQISLKSVIQEMSLPPSVPPESTTMEDDNEDTVRRRYHESLLLSNLPPSVKPELLAVTFALLVHTYCELLEVGMESTAHTIRDAFAPIYETHYSAEYRDLYQVVTTEDMLRLNSYNSQHMEALAALKTILVQVASYQLRREELNAQQTISTAGAAGLDEQQQKEQGNNNDKRIAEYDNAIAKLKQRYGELSQRAATAFDKMHDLPFLRRARAVRWQLTLSTNTYGMLASFLNNNNSSDRGSLLCMSTLLQTKCELHVEQRDPVPFVPACVLDETTVDGNDKGLAARLNLNQVEINWAAPMPRSSGNKNDQHDIKLPFPKYNIDQEYETEEEAARDKKIVEFNRALLVNGFRRLEALERKREYEVLSAPAQKRLKAGQQVKAVADPLKPSILLTTLCASSSGPLQQQQQQRINKPPSFAAANSRATTTTTFTDVSAIWEEAGIGLCCAKFCGPDGRRIAVGCDDSAVRIWSAVNGGGGSTTNNNNNNNFCEPLQVLLGHKNGFPVFDVDWNRDGRCVLSGGGDGSVRLWDTMAVGPYGEVADLRLNSRGGGGALTTSPMKASGAAETLVLDLKPENAQYTSGAALAVYRGHAPSSPVWSVAFSPSGYYFASAGGDATARLWTTDRLIPVRLLTGHTSANVNCVEWHPNCNYIITGSDDKSARLWDIQTGRTVRLLNGCADGINAVQISPGGRYAAGADYGGVVHLWDLGTGKKVTEFRTIPLASRSKSNKKQLPPQGLSRPMIHALKFSTCGTALATGGDDCCVRIWDVRADSIANKALIETPVKSFPARQTMIMDLYYTKRNLLLAAGKYLTPVPLAP